MTKDTKCPPIDWRSRYFNPGNLANTMGRTEKLKQILPPGISLPEMALRSFSLILRSVPPWLG